MRINFLQDWTAFRVKAIYLFFYDIENRVGEIYECNKVAMTWNR